MFRTPFCCFRAKKWSSECWRGCAIAERFRSDDTPDFKPTLLRQGYGGQARNTDMKLQEALKGMKVNNWEMRINDKGRRVVYVRFSEKPAPITVTVNEDE